MMTMAKNYLVKEDMTLSRFGESRYVVVDAQTQQVLDDAQGFGYRTKRRAHTGYAYKNRYPPELQTKWQKEVFIQNWMCDHAEFIQVMDQIYVEITKGAWGDKAVFDAKFVKKMLKEHGLEPMFSAADLLKVWRKTG